MIAKKKEEEALWECYRRLFAASTPPGDFDLMLENATVDSQGRKHIPFMEHEILQTDMDRIITEVIKEYKIAPKYRANAFRMSILLGASPKTKQIV